ncbi:MAG: hypothetical protein P8Z75_06860 [Gammaproteobacteria bacterium]
MSTLLRTLILAIGMFYAAFACAAAEQDSNGLKDLYYGEALYYANQHDYFSAISRLDTELAEYYGLDQPEKNSFHFYQDHAEFDVGDFELYYRMYNRASRAVKLVIHGNVPERVRNGAIYRLAKIYYESQQPRDALATIKTLKGKVPDKIRYKEPFLRAQIDIETGRFKEAIALLKKIENAPGMVGFAGYNLGVALLKSGKQQAGIAELDKVGQLVSDDRAVQAIRDKANLVLGFRLLEDKQPAMAKKYLDRVRVTGPFSNKALLGAGWAAAATGKYERALVPWTILSKRNVTNKAVQEVMLGLPYAYSKLGVYGKAAVLYGQSLQDFSNEIARLDASIKSIREGRFLAALIREEIKKDPYWVVHLRKLPKTPETYYLLDMLASDDFQSSLKNYFDLAELRRKLKHWETYIGAYQEMIKIRAAYYEPLLPQVQAKFRILDSKMKLRLEQRAHLERRLKKMLVAPRPDFLETVNERRTLSQLDQMEKSLPPGADPKIQARIARLRGVIIWHVDTEYQDRFSKATKHLHELDVDVKRLRRIYHSFVRTRQAATQSYQGYDKELTQLSIKMQQADDTIKQLMARQGHMIEVMAINELERRRTRLEKYQVKARFAMAESYDRATKAQQAKVIEQSKKKDAAQEEEKVKKAKKAEKPQQTQTPSQAKESKKADK